MTTDCQIHATQLKQVTQRVDELLRDDRAHLRTLLGNAIVARLRAEKELRQSRLELDESRKRFEAQTRSLQEQNAVLEDAMRRANDAAAVKSAFLANMSHELRTPMTAILGFAEMLEQMVGDPECLDAIHIIRRNGEHLIEIINDILDLSKIEAGRLEVERLPCSAIEIVSEVISLMRVRSEAKGLSLDAGYSGPIPERIVTDPTRLRQALLNLVANAIKFTEVGGVNVLIRLDDKSADQPRLRFDVCDTGIGMTDEQISRLFRPFTQADSSMARRFGGTGLGLTISRRLVEMLGGTISVKSDQDLGSTFSMTVETGPLDQQRMLEYPTRDLDCGAGVPKAFCEIRRLNCRILLAEDGPDNQRLIGFALKKAGATVEVVENGLLAFERIMGSAPADAVDDSALPPIDVVVMDMQMPVLDGYGATRKLREAGYRGPIVALTAHAMAGDREKCLAAGCDEYATKPIDRKQLIDLIASVVPVPAAI